MANPYPIEQYRSKPASFTGFQSPSAASPFPANDNSGRMGRGWHAGFPFPNVPQKPAPSPPLPRGGWMPQAAQHPGLSNPWATAARGLGRNIFRRTQAGIAWDLAKQMAPTIQRYITFGTQLWWSQVMNTGGWTLQSSCPFPGVFSVPLGGTQLCGVGVPLLVLIAQANSNPAFPLHISTYGPPVTFAGGGFNVRRSQTWVRTAGNTGRAPRYWYTRPNPARRPLAVPPAVEPWPFPFTPAPNPWTVPYRAIPRHKPNPNRAPSERRDRNNGPNRNPAPHKQWEITPGNRDPRTGQPHKPRLRDAPDLHPKNRKKEKNEKERKARAVGVGGTLPGQLVSALTEAGDVINAFWKSLPPQRRGCFANPKTRMMVCPRRSLENKMRDLYDHWEELRFDELVENLVLNQIEDYVFGQLGHVNAQAAREFGNMTGRPVGFQFGHLH